MGRLRRGWLSVLAALFLSGAAWGGETAASGASAAAFEDEIPLDLAWQAPPGCPGSDVLLQRVMTLIAKRAPGRTDRLSVRVVITPTQRGFGAVLATAQSGSTGERTLAADTCAELVEGLALVVALALTPTVTEAAPIEPAPASAVQLALEPVPAEARRPPRRAEVAPPAAPSEKVRGISGFVLVSALLDAGVIADAAAGAAAGAGARFGSVEATFRGLWLPERRSWVAGQDKGGDFWFAGGQLGACRAFAVSAAMKLGPCAGLELGVIAASAVGTVEQKQPQVLLLSPSASALFRFDWADGMAVRVEASAAAPLSRPRFVLENVGIVRTLPWLTARFGAGLEASIP